MIILGSIDILSKEGTTQGDNLAMAFYALGTTPLSNVLQCASTNVKQVCLADDITGAGKLENLRKWWDIILNHGSKIGYYVNQGKSWLILKDAAQMPIAREIFKGTGIQFTTEGQRHLGVNIGSNEFRTQYATGLVKQWCDEMIKLSEFAKTEPHAAYSAFCHGEIHKYTYFMRTIPGMNEYMEPLDEIIESKFLPALINSIVSDADRQLYSLPVRYGGLGIPILSEHAEMQLQHSKEITLPLLTIMIIQGSNLPSEPETNDIKRKLLVEKESLMSIKVQNVEQNQLPQTVTAMKDAQLPGASSWLSVLPLAEYGFTLNKSEFRDAIALRYGKEPKGLPSVCPCGQKFDVTHALNCKKGGFVTIRHNNIRDYEASLLSKIVADVETEPALQPVEGEVITGLQGDNARSDVRARGVWRAGQNAFFDVRVTNPHSASQSHLTTEKVLEKHEKEKKRQYNRRIMNIEHGSFTPWVFSVFGGMGKECSIFHKHVAERIATKTEERYEKILSAIRCKLSFIILKSVLMCVRGSRSFKEKFFDDFEIASDLARIV